MPIEAPRNVLVVGSGAREHALGWKIRQDSPKTRLYFAPGNGGTQQLGRNLDVEATDIDRLTNTAVDQGIDFVVIGPERPIVEGLTDAFEDHNRQNPDNPVGYFGPTQAASFLEADKAEAVSFMEKYNIPHPESRIFEDYEEARHYVWHQEPNTIVVKASGLAEGKGVVLPDSKEEAVATLRDMMLDGRFGEAGRKVVVQERLFGKEVSVIGFMSNEIGLLVPAQDYKRAEDGDKGPNTGGMGAYAPNEFMFDEWIEISETILYPTRDGMIDQGTPFKGALYVGIMLTADGPKVLEYNIRFGDPETQVQMLLLKSNLLKAMQSTMKGKLSEGQVRSSDEAAVGVVIASSGYPGKYEKGKRIAGLNSVDEDIVVFHAGTKMNTGGELETSGGRVLTVTAKAPSIEEARRKVYESIAQEPRDKGVWVENSFHRHDITG